jgi:hypothetical protein
MKQISLIFVTLHLLFSCSVNYHLNKAIKKGYRCDEISDTIKITSVDSFPVILHDSIVWEKISIQKDTIVRYRTSYVPKTRIEYRMDIKRFNDSMSYIRNMYSDSLDAVIKINKQESKVAIKTRKKSPNLFIIGLLTGIILTLIFKYAINQALKKFTRINF